MCLCADGGGPKGSGGAKGVTAQFGGKLHKAGGRHGHGDQFHPAGFRPRQRRQSAQRGDVGAGNGPAEREGKRGRKGKGAISGKGKGAISDIRTVGRRNDRAREKGPSLIFGLSGDGTTENFLRGIDGNGLAGPLVRKANGFLTLVRREHRIMFSMPRPGNEGRRLREFAVSGHDGIRLVSVRYDHRRGDTYVWAWDDGPPGAELDPLDEEVGVPIASLDCSKLIVYDGQQGWTWLDTDLAHREVPREGQRGQWRVGSGEWRVRSGEWARAVASGE